MFTVRWKGIHDEDVLFQAARIIKCNIACDKDSGLRKGQSMVECYNADFTKAFDHIYYGTVFVMNEAGATVAKYELGGWELAAGNVPPLESKKKRVA